MENSSFNSTTNLPSENVEPVKVTILGSGTYGTAMATVAARQGHQLVMYSRDESQVSSINEKHINSNYLSEFTLLDNITATTSVQVALEGAELVMNCIPAQKTPGFLKDIKDYIPPEAILCSTSKGLYLETKELLSEPILRAIGRDQPLAILSGPSFAKELMEKQPSAVVVASKYLYHAVRVQRLLSSIDFRIYSSQDIVGTQLGGALKNPLAIGAGMIEGGGFGINTLTAFLTRSSLELQKLCVAMGGNQQTISGLAGIGDLMLTGFGSLSRNRSLGLRLMKGEKIDDIMADYTVEGVPTAEVAVYFADKCGLDLPIFKAVNAILKGKVAIENVQQLLMNRPLKQET